MTVNEVLKTARGFIAKPENWIVGTRTDFEGRHCALGAIDAAAGCFNSVNLEAVKALSAVIDDNIPHDPCNNCDAPSLLKAEGSIDAHAIRVAAHNNARGYECTLAAFDRAIETTK